jgi:Flp pilus assembly protein TadB
MSSYAALTGVGTSIALVGVLLLIRGLHPPAAGAPRARTRFSRVRAAGAGTATRRRLTKTTVAAVAGTVVWVVSGWPVAGVVAAVGVVWVPFFFAAAGIAARRIERLEALEEWVRRLADAMAAGSAPVQTLVRSAAHAPEPIRPEVTELAAQLGTARSDRAAALHRFAHQLDDPLGDMVVLALEIALSAPASQKVPEVLRALAGEVSDEVRVRRKIETDRAQPRNEARTIVVIQILFVTGVSAFTGYVHVYGTGTGQLVLAAFGTVVLCALWLLRRFSLDTPPPRILAHHPDTDNTATTGTGGRMSTAAVTR